MVFRKTQRILDTCTHSLRLFLRTCKRRTGIIRPCQSINHNKMQEIRRVQGEIVTLYLYEIWSEPEDEATLGRIAVVEALRMESLRMILSGRSGHHQEVDTQAVSGGATVGNSTKNVDPTPGSDVNPTLPSMSSTRVLQIERPSPVPLCCRASEESI